ncbi:MAG: tail fiber domain-containing protein [Flavobacteriales bacterium]|nr:tail fiber domain-containing protein [Flavobacteriales bacterium]
MFGKATAPNSWAGWFEGNVMINGNGFLTGMIPITSDANLKTNVQALTNASEFLDQLLPKTYDFLVDEHPEIALPSGPQMGFIAQDVELILPQLVKQATIPATYDSTGAQLTASEDITTLNYIGTIPILVAGSQHQQATIAQLQDQINNCCSAQGGVAPQGGSEHRMVPQENDLHEQRLLIIPNPVADLTMLEYYVPKAGKVSLQVSTSDGKPLATLREELAEAGAYNYSWNTTKLAAGTYFCTFMLDGAVVVKRAVKVK